jgi:hypothetical protein
VTKKVVGVCAFFASRSTATPLISNRGAECEREDERDRHAVNFQSRGRGEREDERERR